MWTLNLGKPANIPKLNETMAIELGANLLGEFVIYSIGAGLLIYEYMRYVAITTLHYYTEQSILICWFYIDRQASKEALKEAATQDEKKLLQLTLQNLALEIERQDAQLRYLSRTVADLESRKWLPKLKILSSDKKDDDSGGRNGGDYNDVNKVNLKLLVTNTETKNDENPSENTTKTGNFNPNDGIIMKSLNLIENEIFYSEQQPAGKGSIIRNALVFLKYDLYN